MKWGRVAEIIRDTIQDGLKQDRVCDCEKLAAESVAAIRKELREEATDLEPQAKEG